MIDRLDLDELDARIRTLLPEDYQESYESLQPVPMRSAGLQYRADGRVAWDRIWGSFCDLAIAGGPPHKGRLLEPGRQAAIDAAPDRYDEVAEEICRGVRMAADLDAEPAPAPGWVRVLCSKRAMAGWLVRAIATENVAVRTATSGLDVPAAPHFRIDREIKNVVTVVAKTSHYWAGHMPRSQWRAIEQLFTGLAERTPLLEPCYDHPAQPDAHGPVVSGTAAAIQRETGLRASPHHVDGWLGLECPSVAAAIWLMRALVACNVLARREETVLFVPVNPAADPDGSRVAATMAAVHRLAAAKSLV